jgi:RNA recognition motif-containing protein
MKAKRRIHVANIPYELKREEIIDLFEMAGPVIDCELINDTSGKFKGSAFIEYPDQFTAKSALRNLHRIEIKGRSLKISEAHADKSGGLDVGQIINDDNLSNDEDLEQKSTQKEIEEVVRGLQSYQKNFLLGAMKELCNSNTDEFKQILIQDEKTFELVSALQKDLKIDRNPRQNNRGKYDMDMMMTNNNYQSHNTMYQQPNSQQTQQSMMMNLQSKPNYNPIPIQQLSTRTSFNQVQGNINQGYLQQPTLSPTGGKMYNNQFGGNQIGMNQGGYRSDNPMYGQQFGHQSHQQNLYGHQGYHHMGDMDVQMGQHGQMGGMQQYGGGQYGDGNMGMYGGGNQGNMMYYNQQGNTRKY